MTHTRLEQAEEIKPFIVQLRRAIHKKPELGFEVHATARLVAETLHALGIDVQTGVGKTGVVGNLGDGDGPTVAIRADMDALPIQEDTGLDFSSEAPGVMHACGHDAHTAMLLGAARLLSQQPIKGRIRFLFQPAEEVGGDGTSGAPRMIADGALKGVDRAIGLHVNGWSDVGTVMVGSGYFLAAADFFRGEVIGTGGHGAAPHRGSDPIWLTNQVMSALYAVPSRRIDPLEPNVLSLGVVRGGSAPNVIPNSVHIEGTLRSMDPDVRVQLRQEVERCFGVARALGGDYSLTIEPGYPSLNNDADVAAVISATVKDLLGEGSLAQPRRSMGAEDFSYMSNTVPSAFFMLGVRKPGGANQNLHTPTFTLEEDALPIGAAMLAEAATRLLAIGKQ
jgi:amidohydrolase